MDEKPTKKRKRQDKPRPKTNGIIEFPNLTRSVDDLNDKHLTGSPISRCTCNGGVQNCGSRTNLINVVQPQVNYDTNHGPLETRRQRQISFGLGDDDEEETVVKEVDRQSIGLNRNVSLENVQFQQNQQCVEVYAFANAISPESSPGAPCQAQSCVSNVPPKCISKRVSEVEILRSINAEQQKRIAFLYEKCRKDRQSRKQRRSGSATSLQASPLQRAEETYYHKFHPSTSQRNIHAEHFTEGQNDRVFIFPERKTSIPQQRSRSCDFLLDDVERDPFLTPSPDIHTTPGASSGYERVTHITESDNNNNGNEIKEDLRDNKRFNFKRGFVMLLILNAIIIALNTVGIPFLVAKRTDSHEKDICINCEDIDYRYTEKFQKVNEKCCIGSVNEMFELFANVSHGLHDAPAKSRALRSLNELPMVQYDAQRKVKRDNITMISWAKDKQNPIQKVFGKLDDKSEKIFIEIPVTGTYFIYSNVRFIKNGQAANNPLIYGHSIVKHKGGVLGSAVETCFPYGYEVRHISHLSFMYNFTSKESLYVTVQNGNDFSTGGTTLGIFLLGEDTFK